MATTDEERKVYHKKWYQENKERAQANNKAWRENNKERAQANNKAWRENNKEKAQTTNKAWLENNKERKLAGDKAWYENNKERKQATSKAWLGNNKERKLTTDKAWRQANTHKIAAYDAEKRCIKLKATPVWSETKQIAELYKRSKEITTETGIPHHVDHIIPLTNPLVCGLHCIDNLQILTATENLTKSNKFEICLD